MTYAPAPAQLLFRSRTWLHELALVAGGAVVLAVLGQCTLPVRPVPVTGQTLGVLLVGGLLGFRRGTAAVLAWLSFGLAGLPVFALGASGPQVLLGPTGGYLVGFLGAAGFVGLAAEHGLLRGMVPALLVCALALLPVFALGIAWLGGYVPRGTALAAGLWPFLPGEIVKLAIAATVLPPLQRRRSRRA